MAKTDSTAGTSMGMVSRIRMKTSMGMVLWMSRTAGGMAMVTAQESTRAAEHEHWQQLVDEAVDVGGGLVDRGHHRPPLVLARADLHLAGRQLLQVCAAAFFELLRKKTERERLHLPMWQARSHSSCQGR